MRNEARQRRREVACHEPAGEPSSRCAPREPNGAPGRNRTCDNQLRRLGLYPTELRAQLKSKWLMAYG